MRRGWTWGLALCLLLTGCGAGGEQPVRKPEETPKKETLEPAPEGLTMELEHAVYDPSLTSYTYLIHNGTDAATGLFGTPYAIQRWDGSGWADLSLKEGVGWDAVGYTLEPGQTMALSCGFWLYKETPEAGEYRLVKTVGDAQLTAEFSLGESLYTAERPYGFAPLEELPERYGASAAAGSGAVIFRGSSEENLPAVEAFLEKVALDVPCQLRTVQDQGEGVPMVIDVVYENDCFLWRMRSGGTEVVERRLSYLVTDGTDLYLSNGVDWESGERFDDQRIFLVPPMRGTAWVEKVAAMTADRLEWNAARYKVWSGDGAWYAGLTEEPTAFSVGYQGRDGSWANSYDLADWDGLETAVTGISWQEDGTLRLECETTEGISVLTFDPETEELRDALCGLPTAL